MTPSSKGWYMFVSTRTIPYSELYQNLTDYEYDMIISTLYILTGSQRSYGGFDLLSEDGITVNVYVWNSGALDRPGRHSSVTSCPAIWEIYNLLFEWAR